MKALVYHGPGRRGWDTVPDLFETVLNGIKEVEDGSAGAARLVLEF